MKKLVVQLSLILICCLGFTSMLKAQSTTCDLTIAGSTGKDITYEVKFRVWDTWTPPGWWSPNWTNFAQCYYGFNDNFYVPLGVDPDCQSRWVLVAWVNKKYLGTTIDTQYGYSTTLSSSQFVAGNIAITVTFP